MEDFELELKLDFLEESEDLLESAENAFLQLENDRENPELLNNIFRLAHNLKGTSRAVGFSQLAELTHTAENLILKLKDGTMTPSDVVVSTLLDFKDLVNQMVEGLKQDINANFDISGLQHKIESLISGEVQSDLVSDPVENKAQDAKSNHSDQAGEPVQESFIGNDAVYDSLRENGFSEEEIEALKNEAIPSASAFEEEVKSPQAQAATEPQKTEDVAQKESSASSPKKNKAETDESIRVKLSRIDMINNVIGELVILQTVISQRRFEFVQDDLTNKSIGMMGKLFKEVQELAMSLRMLPLKTTFQKMARIVRDTSKALEKDVQLNLVGEDTEVDKTVLEKLSDPLVHIVRNAVDHGLEAPEVREAAGKNKTGVVELFAYHEGSNLVIQITDDGKGIDPEVIRNKAIDKGIISSGSNISDQEVIQLIFHPGFSTKEQVTEVSGRGVGMDVVKTNIEQLGGEVKLMSKVGQGSSLKIILPLTLAIIEGIVIRADEEKYVLPLSQIYEITRVRSSEIEDFSGVAKLFRLRGEVLPLFYINKKIGKKADQDLESQTVIVVRGLNYVFGVVVDDIINQQQIVIKKLGEDIKNMNGIIGSAIMADGMPSLIIDLFELFKNDFKESRGHKKYIEQLNKAG